MAWDYCESEKYIALISNIEDLPRLEAAAECKARTQTNSS